MFENNNNNNLVSPVYFGLDVTQEHEFFEDMLVKAQDFMKRHFRGGDREALRLRKHFVSFVLDPMNMMTKYSKACLLDAILTLEGKSDVVAICSIAFPDSIWERLEEPLSVTENEYSQFYDLIGDCLRNKSLAVFTCEMRTRYISYVSARDGIELAPKTFTEWALLATSKFARVHNDKFLDILTNGLDIGQETEESIFVSFGDRTCSHSLALHREVRDAVWNSLRRPRPEFHVFAHTSSFCWCGKEVRVNLSGVQKPSDLWSLVHDQAHRCPIACLELCAMIETFWLANTDALVSENDGLFSACYFACRQADHPGHHNWRILGETTPLEFVSAKCNCSRTYVLPVVQPTTFLFEWLCGAHDGCPSMALVVFDKLFDCNVPRETLKEWYRSIKIVSSQNDFHSLTVQQRAEVACVARFWDVPAITLDCDIAFPQSQEPHLYFLEDQRLFKINRSTRAFYRRFENKVTSLLEEPKSISFPVERPRWRDLSRRFVPRLETIPEEREVVPQMSEVVPQVFHEAFTFWTDPGRKIGHSVVQAAIREIRAAIRDSKDCFIEVAKAAWEACSKLKGLVTGQIANLLLWAGNLLYQLLRGCPNDVIALTAFSGLASAAVAHNLISVIKQATVGCSEAVRVSLVRMFGEGTSSPQPQASDTTSFFAVIGTALVAIAAVCCPEKFADSWNDLTGVASKYMKNVHLYEKNFNVFSRAYEALSHRLQVMIHGRDYKLVHLKSHPEHGKTIANFLAWYSRINANLPQHPSSQAQVQYAVRGMKEAMIKLVAEHGDKKDPLLEVLERYLAGAERWLSTARKSGSRTVPYSIHLCGPPGIGKTTFVTKKLATFIGANYPWIGECEIEDDDGVKIVRPDTLTTSQAVFSLPELASHSGDTFDSVCPVMFLDELSQEKGNCEEMTEKQKIWFTVNGDAQFSLPGSAIEQKNTIVNVGLVIASDNDPLDRTTVNSIKSQVAYRRRAMFAFSVATAPTNANLLQNQTAPRELRFIPINPLEEIRDPNTVPRITDPDLEFVQDEIDQNALVGDWNDKCNVHAAHREYVARFRPGWISEETFLKMSAILCKKYYRRLLTVSESRPDFALRQKLATIPTPRVRVRNVDHEHFLKTAATVTNVDNTGILQDFARIKPQMDSDEVRTHIWLNPAALSDIGNENNHHVVEFVRWVTDWLNRSCDQETQGMRKVINSVVGYAGIRPLPCTVCAKCRRNFTIAKFKSQTTENSDVDDLVCLMNYALSDVFHQHSTYQRARTLIWGAFHLKALKKKPVYATNPLMAYILQGYGVECEILADDQDWADQMMVTPFSDYPVLEMHSSGDADDYLVTRVVRLIASRIGAFRVDHPDFSILEACTKVRIDFTREECKQKAKLAITALIGIAGVALVGYAGWRYFPKFKRNHHEMTEEMFTKYPLALSEEEKEYLRLHGYEQLWADDRGPVYFIRDVKYWTRNDRTEKVDRKSLEELGLWKDKFITFNQYLKTRVTPEYAKSYSDGSSRSGVLNKKSTKGRSPMSALGIHRVSGESLSGDTMLTTKGTLQLEEALSASPRCPETEEIFDAVGGVVSQSLCDTNARDIIALVASNVFSIKFGKIVDGLRNGSRKTTGCFLTDHWGITVSHGSWQSKPAFLEIRHKGTVKTLEGPSFEWYYHPQKDIAMFFSRVPFEGARNIARHIQEKPFPGEAFQGILVGRSPDWDTAAFQHVFYYCVRAKKNVQVSYSVKDSNGRPRSVIMNDYGIRADTKGGECGAILVDVTCGAPNGRIRGMHVAGYDEPQYAQTQKVTAYQVELSHSVLEEMVKYGSTAGERFRMTYLIGPQTPAVLDAHQADAQMLETFGAHIGQPLGKLSFRVGGNDKEKEIETPLYWRKLPSELQNEVEHYDRAVRSAENKSLARAQLLEATHKQRYHRYDKAVREVCEMFEDCATYSKWPRDPLPWKDMCRAVPELNLPATPSATSSGWPWSACRRELWGSFVPPDTKNLQTKGAFMEMSSLGFRVLKDWYVAHLEDIEDRIMRGDVPDFPFTVQWKAEALPVEKVEQGKVRQFQAGNQDLHYLMRKWFGAFIGWCTEEHIDNEIGVGITPHEYGYLFERNVEVAWGDGEVRVFAGDFKKFDSSVSGALGENLALIWINWYGNDGGTHHVSPDLPPLTDANYMRWCLWLAVTCPVLIEDCLVFRNGSGQPSGHLMTTLVNCLVQQVIFREAFRQLAPGFAYKDHVRAIFCGDDSLVAVSEEVAPLFNQKTVGEALDRLGFTYTDASKTGDLSASLKKMNEVDFLKRKFVFNTEAGKMVGALVQSSMDKMFQFSPKNAPAFNLHCTVFNALEEASLHGRESFEKYRNFFSRALGLPTNAFPAFETVSQWVFTQSETTRGRLQGNFLSTLLKTL